MSGLHDPLTKKRWAGSARELEVCADHVRAEDEVLRRSRDVLKANLSDGEGGKGHKGEGKGDGAAPKAMSKKEKAKLGRTAPQPQGAEQY